MSTSPARRRRLHVARTFAQATCSTCGASLAKVWDPLAHLERCERLAEAKRLEAQLSTPEPEPRVPLWRRLLGLTSRGAAG